jgi:hypothetical protein
MARISAVVADLLLGEILVFPALAGMNRRRRL